MKYNCNIVKDLMPLYSDKVLSEESKTMIREHISECADCKNIFDSMEKETAEKEEEAEQKAVKKYAKQIKRIRIAMVCLFIVLAFFVGVRAFLTEHTHCSNPVSAATGLYTVMYTDTPYAIIQEEPVIIILSKDRMSFDEVLSSVNLEGYKEDTEMQLAGDHFFKKNGKTIIISESGNSYFYKYEIDK